MMGSLYGLDEYEDEKSLMSHKIRKVALLCEGKTLLDVGCGGGHFINLVKEKFNYIVGIEPEKELFALCVKRFESCSNIEILPFGIDDMVWDEDAKKFDCAVALDVIEHVDDPFVALCNIRDCINPNGTFIMTTPREFDWVWRVLVKNPQHKTIHGIRGWKALVLKAGFDVVKADYIMKKFGIGACCLIVAKPKGKD